MRFIVVIPVYNGEQWIERCLDSVVSQDYNDYEVIIIAVSYTHLTLPTKRIV